MNTFCSTATLEPYTTLSGNGALKYSTSLDAFVDQFASTGKYLKPRSRDEIDRDQALLWSIDPALALKFTLYLRMITRETKYLDSETGTYVTTSASQKGAELRHESIMRMRWILENHPQVCLENIMLFLSAGSIKDVFTLFENSNDSKSDYVFSSIVTCLLMDDQHRQLLLKFLPQIRSESRATTKRAKRRNRLAKLLANQWFAKESNPKIRFSLYRKLKSSGTAHSWQQLISRGQFDQIDFNTIHGRALTLLSRSKFLANQKLTEKYAEWIKSPETKNVKVTGFVHDLFAPLSSGRRLGVGQEVVDTINQQFNSLIEKAKSSQITKLIVVRDTSGSMESKATGSNLSSHHIAKALSLYFSEFLQGEFADCWIEFANDAEMRKWSGQTPVEKWHNDLSAAYGSTNFMSVIELFCTMKARGVNEADFPEGILCISDGEFDPAHDLSVTNVTAARKLLSDAGFSKEYVENFIIILWNIHNSFYCSKRETTFETSADTKNVFYFSGFNGAIISFLSDKIKTPRELFEAAMNQEILNQTVINL